MEEQKTREILEGLEIPSEKIDELINIMKEQELHPLKDGDRIGDAVISIGGLKEQLNREIDWRKKAQIAAKIISLGLE